MRDREDMERVRRTLRRMNRMRDFPFGTCPASRHTAMMAEYLVKGGYPMLQDEPVHCAGSIASTVAALWSARRQLRRLGYRWSVNSRGAIRWRYEPEACAAIQRCLETGNEQDCEKAWESP